MRAFELTLDNAELFYSICKELNLNTEEERAFVLNYMAENGFTTRVWETARTKDQFVKDIAKNFKVIRITQNQKVDN